MADENPHQASIRDPSDPHKVYPDRSVLGGEIGLWSSDLNALPAPQARKASAEIEELGYAALWFGEALGREAFTNASMLLSATNRLVVATGIANIFVRDAWATNAAAKTIAGAYPGRFVLGLGVSHRSMVEMRGHDYSSPLSTMRTYLQDMREARFTAMQPEHNPPWLLAALGPRMLELSRDLADGAHPYLVTPQHTARAREILGEGPLLAVEQAVILTSEREEALPLGRSHLSRYMRLPNYRNSWLRQGFKEEDLLDGGSDQLVEGLVTWGSPYKHPGSFVRHLRSSSRLLTVGAAAGNIPVELASSDKKKSVSGML